MTREIIPNIDPERRLTPESQYRAAIKWHANNYELKRPLQHAKRKQKFIDEFGDNPPLAALEEKHREVLTRWINGMAMRPIAEALEPLLGRVYSPQGIKLLKDEALARLRELKNS